MSAKWRVLRNARTGRVVLDRVKLCDSFWCRFRGLQLVRHLPENEGLLFVTSSESRANTTIHMLFMLFSIGVVWLDASGRVVDKTLAKPWRPAYAPQKPAQYFVEARPSILERVQVGDTLRFDEVVS
ncbi:MAG: DUF192 domain-containing protein [Chloroflexi bacterium]|nr:DUF192 domain-containing protein [Chloroflexota bacterium]